MGGLGFSLDNWVRLDWVWIISTLLNGLLDFKGPTHLILTQTHLFGSPGFDLVKCDFSGPYTLVCRWSCNYGSCCSCLNGISRLARQ